MALWLIYEKKNTLLKGEINQFSQISQEIIFNVLNVKMTEYIGGILSQLSNLLPQKEVQTVVVKEIENMSLSQGRSFVRVAGLSGGLAVIMSAYGAHGKLVFFYKENM